MALLECFAGSGIEQRQEGVEGITLNQSLVCKYVA